METLTLVACAVLVVGGSAKVRSPEPTFGAMRAIGVPATTAMVRIMGGVEVVIGIIAGVTGWRLALILVSAAYVGFLAFVAAALRSSTAIRSCGCFGSVDSPPSRIHLVIDAVFAVFTMAAAIEGMPSLGALLAGQPMASVPFVLTVGALTYLAFVAMTVVPVRLRTSHGRA